MCVLVVFASLRSAPARAKNPEEPETAVPVGSDMDFLDHDRMGPFWLGAEVNSIFQTNLPFHAPYPDLGAKDARSFYNSFDNSAGAAISGLATVFLGYRPF